MWTGPREAGREAGERTGAERPLQRNKSWARCIYNTALKGARPPINHTVSLTGIKIAPWHPAHACAWNSAGPAKPSAPGPTLWSSGRSFHSSSPLGSRLATCPSSPRRGCPRWRFPRWAPQSPAHQTKAAASGAGSGQPQRGGHTSSARSRQGQGQSPAEGEEE